jgi:beta-glucanase (GH16 family)
MRAIAAFTCVMLFAGLAPLALAEGWALQGPLGQVPERISDTLPLSDQDNTGNWTLDKVFSDEFHANSLNDTRWDLVPSGQGDDPLGQSPAVFTHENVTVSGGMLHIAFRKERMPWMNDNPDFDYTSGLVHTHERTHYGYYETRAKAMNSAGSSAFWLSWTGLPDNATEIDIFEIGGKTKEGKYDRLYNMHAHIWGTPESQEHKDIGAVWKAPWRLADDFHVYGFDWQEDLLRWYVDGVLVRSLPNTNWHFPMQMVFDSEAMWNWFGEVDEADLPSSFDVDYVRVWRRGE